jgi:hypothetical protein
MYQPVVWQKLTNDSEMRIASIIMAIALDEVSTSETSAQICQITKCNTPGNSYFHTRGHENLKSHL